MNPGRFSLVRATLWNSLRSLKLTLVTLFLLAGGSVFGTLLPQNLPLSEYQHRLGPVVARLIQIFQLHDMYHSWWFFGLLGLFAANLAACSLHRLPGVWTQVTNPDLTPSANRLQSRPQYCTWQEPGAVEVVAQNFTHLIRRRFADVRRTEKDGVIWLFAQRQAWSRFGAYVTHVAILIILLGGVVGGIWGFRGYVTIAEGQSVDHLILQTAQSTRPLGFSVRCDQFSVDYYPGSDRPREFRSLLTVLENGKEVAGQVRVPVRVNYPLHYRGMTFYQSDYGVDAYVFRFLVTPQSGGDSFELVMSSDKTASLPDGTSVAIAGYVPDFDGQGPVAGLEIFYPGGERGRAMAFHDPELISKDGASPYAFRLMSIEQRFYTGLQVNSDPGVPLVWFGCLLLVVGTLAAFYFSHQRLWVQLQEENGAIHVLLAGYAHRQREAFAQRFENLCRDLQQGVSKEQP
jgi:cytochrome c biogenesis protein